MGKACMHEDQSDPVVQYVQRAAVDAHQWDHDGLEGDDHGGYHQRKGDIGDHVAVAHNIVCQHGCQKGYQHSGTACHDQGILKGI